MQVTETLNEGLKRKLSLVIPKSDLTTRLDARLGELKGQANIKGFRPGKVPESHLRKMYGKSAMAEAAQWLKGEETVRVTLWNEVPLIVYAPNTVELTIAETDPGLRGDTATGGTKPAKLETGAVVKVPLFINEGEKIKVDTRTGEYLSRVGK